MAMRSIPAILNYCRLIEEHAAPDAILSTLLTLPDWLPRRSLNPGQTSGLWHLRRAIRTDSRTACILNCDEADLKVECYGLNHFSWFTHFTVKGEDVTDKLVSNPALYSKTAMQYFSPVLVQLCDKQLLE